MYQKQDDKIKGSVDWLVVSLYFVLIVGGWFSIYGASYDEKVAIFDFSKKVSLPAMQLIWISTAFVLGFVLLKLDHSVYDIFAYLIYAFFLFLLFITIFLAPDIKGSHSWLEITSKIRLQPAEFAKFAVALTLAKYISEMSGKLLSFRNLTVVSCIILFPVGLILLQNETGSALVYFAFIVMLYREGLPGIVLVLGLCIILLFVVGIKYSLDMMGMITQGEFISIIIVILVSSGLVLNYKKEAKISFFILLGAGVVFGSGYALAFFHVSVNWGFLALLAIGLLFLFFAYKALKTWSKIYLFLALFTVGSIGVVYSVSYVFTDVMLPHQQVRIKSVLNMEKNLKEADYNVNQSKIAIGSGGFTGKGFLNGTQTKLNYVPEQATDFIFCTVGEEQGFVGTVSVMLLFLILILRLIYLSERQRSTFGRVYGYCVVSVFLFHLVINVGMVVGIMPVIGIPLPFFSYGGSSLWAFTILLFIFLRIDMSRKRR